MADTPALEAGESNLVEVQVLSPALSERIKRNISEKFGQNMKRIRAKKKIKK